MSEKFALLKGYKHEIILAIGIILGTLALVWLYGILLPFFFGLMLAFACYPAIKGIQKAVKSQTLATTIFLLALVGIILTSGIFLAQFINRDFKRLNQSLTVLISKNSDKIDATAAKAKEYLHDLINSEVLREQLQAQTDSLANFDMSQLDTESIKATLESLAASLKGDGEETVQTKEEKSSGPSFSFTMIFFSTLFYFVIILYQIDYFQRVKERYFSKKVASVLTTVWDDFNQSFVRYFKLRAKIVLLLSLLYLVAFLIMDMPGTVLILLLIILLSFIPYMQYLTLIPLALGCLVLSIEHDHSFLMYYGIVIGVFLLASLLEELVLNPWIMEKNIGLNPVIMVLALSIWGYLLGTVGVVIGIPLTSLLIIYVKRVFLGSYEKVLKE